MNEKKLGLGNVVSISVGLVVATSCLVSLGNGAGTLGVTFILAMAIAMHLCQIRRVELHSTHLRHLALFRH